MDLPIYLGLGLLAGGYLLNQDGKQSRSLPTINTKNRDDQHENKKSGGHNIYDSGYFHKVREIEDERIIAKFEQSFDPINTNVIPYFFNTLNESSVQLIPNPQYDLNLFQKELAKIKVKRPIELTKLESKSNDLRGVNQNNAIEQGGWSGNPPDGLFAESDFNQNWSELVTRPVGDRDLNNRAIMEQGHNNMVPFFGSTIKQNTNIENRMMSDKVETFTGQFKLDKPHKTEVGPLFAPIQQNPEILAAPRELDRYESNLQIRHNELPFEQIHVGRGLNDGYTARPSGGVHNPLRILPKNIDQFLVNPRTVKEGRVIRGKDSVDKRTAMQEMYKYHPELLVTNNSGERNFTTVGQQTKAKHRSEIIMMPTQRRYSKAFIGHANEQSGSKSTKAKLLPRGKISNKVSFAGTPYRHAVQAEGKKHHNNQQLRFENRDNERSTTEILYGTLGHSHNNPKFTVGQGQTYPHDLAKLTRNQAYVVSSNPTGYLSVTSPKGTVYDSTETAKTTVKETTETNRHHGYIQTSTQVRGPVHDASDRPSTTIKETTEQQTHTGQLSLKSKGPAYDPYDQPATTIKETTEQQTHTGQLSLKSKGLAYDPYDQPATTIKETTEELTRIGNVELNSNYKGKVYDLCDTAKTTLRETTEKNDHMGAISHSLQTKQIAYDVNDIAKTTIRETTEETNHMGGVSHPGKTKQIAYDPFDFARTTHRETTEQHDYLMPVEASYLQDGGGYETAPKDTKVTQRENYSDTFYTGVANQADAPSNPQLYDAGYNMQQNSDKEKIATGRYPTLSSTKVTGGKVNVNIGIKRIDSDTLNQYSAMPSPTYPKSKLPMNQCEITSNKNNLPSSNTYFDPVVLTAFNQNPLTQSLQSWA